MPALMGPTMMNSTLPTQACSCKLALTRSIIHHWIDHDENKLVELTDFEVLKNEGLELAGHTLLFIHVVD